VSIKQLTGTADRPSAVPVLAAYRLYLRKAWECMKKFLLILSTIFTVLTFAGAIYVLTSGGTVNAGYAVIPCAISTACTNGFIWFSNKDNDHEMPK